MSLEEMRAADGKSFKKQRRSVRIAPDGFPNRVFARAAASTVRFEKGDAF